MKNAAVHGEIDAMGQALNSSDSATDVEFSIAGNKLGRLHRACEDDHLIP